jgi:CO/xanthine dehydrogenase FAD-binding subunit
MSAFGYRRPGSLEELLRIKEEERERALLLAGGSNLMVYIKEGSLREGTLVDLMALPELKGVRRSDGVLDIGATEVMADLLASTELRASLPLLTEVLSGFANPLVRARATIGGNVADASPIADTVPCLLCLEASLEVASRRGRRAIPLNAFFTAPGQNVLEPDEVILRLRVPLPRQGHGAWQKLGLRNGTSCSVTSVAVWLEVEGAEVGTIRIACGGVAPAPIRAPLAERAFRGQKLERRSIAELARAVLKDIHPIGDVRGSAEYRREVTARLLARAVRQAAGLYEE